MVLKLFSSFDSFSSFNLNILLLVMFFLCKSWFVFIKCKSLMNQMSKGLLNNFSYKMNFKLMKLLVVTLFFFILILKLVGLIPYMFSVTSHFFIVFGFGLIFWLSFILSSVVIFPLKFFSKFSPLGSPLFLMVLLKLAEMISLSIRPLTLSLRLSMKITTGHMFMILMAFCFHLVMNNFLYLFLSVILMSYFFFEFFVSLIQSFVFSLLVVQYLEEHV